MISNENAARINDSLVKGLPGTNYISIVLNKNASGSGGTASVNLGPDFRDYLSKDEISNNVVIPNRKRYLPDRPTEFVKSVATDLITTINNKKNFNNTVSFAGKTILLIVVIGGLLFVLVILIKGLAKRYRLSLEIYNKTKEVLNECTEIYTKVLGSSSDLSGYEGVTLQKAELINAKVTSLIEDYKVIQTIPSIKSVLFKLESWCVYETKLSKFKEDVLAAQQSINDFTQAILKVKQQTKDPFALIEKAQQEEKDNQTMLFLVNKATEDYNKYKLLYSSELHNLYRDVQRSSNKQEAERASKAFYKVFDQESKDIIALERLKNTLKTVYDYLNNNTNTYYSEAISQDIKDSAFEAYNASISYLDYSNIQPLQQRLDQLLIYVEPLKKADKVYANFNVYKDKLHTNLNSIKCFQFNTEIATLRQSINDVVFLNAKDYERVYHLSLTKLDQEISNLSQRADKFNSRFKVIKSFSDETRKNVLTFLLDKEDYITFDTTVDKYKAEDKEVQYFQEREEKRLKEEKLERERLKRQQTSNSSVNVVVVNTPSNTYFDNDLFNSSSVSSNSSNSFFEDLSSNSNSSNDSFNSSNSSNDSYNDSNSSNDFYSNDDSNSNSTNNEW